MQQLLRGMSAGFWATVPMSAAMLAIHRLLPEEQQRALPPYEVTMRAGREAGAHEQLDDPQDRLALTVASHFGFGAAAGAVYSLLADALPLSGAPAGVLHGLAVWGVSYLGLLPATGLYRPPEREPVGRHAMMIAAHIVWGAALGMLYDNRDGAPRAPYEAERVSF